jgi:two-component system, OmpR family, sensor histidine kinase CiaH
MQKLYKQFAELVTKWKVNYKPDEFFTARIRLTFYYSATAVFILTGASVALYNTILANLTQSIGEREFDLDISQAIITNAKDILLDRFLTVDIVLVFFIVILGFFVTHKTLQPIKSNMQKQKRFIADASHELRTPTAVVISGLEVALSNKKLDFPTAKKILENTLDEMREFSKLSNNLLNISKYDTPIQIEYEPIFINELIKSIVEKNMNLARLKEINIEAKIESKAIVKGNKIELDRVFYNILDNAIKNTAQGGIITVSDKVSFNNYIVTISDNGVGIREDILKKIFDPFFRGDASRSTDGAGLGLTLSKKIIENHKGTISIKSQLNKGTSVMISLPLPS